MSARGYFVVGTDTGVGKTVVACALLRRLAGQGLRVAGMKPVAAGCEPCPEGWCNEDALALQAAANVALPVAQINPYAFVSPIAPHIAAAQAGVVIDLARIEEGFRHIAAQAEWVIVEGAGGLLVPLNDHANMADLAARLGLPLVLVVGMRLGCLNHALLTVEAIERRGLALAGWVANRIDPAMTAFEENLASLTQNIAAPLLGVVPWCDGAALLERVVPVLRAPNEIISTS